MKTIYIGILLGVLVLQTAGCGGGSGGGEPPPVNTNPPVTGNLTNEGTLVTVDGVSLHAMSESLSEPVNVAISQVDMPPDALSAELIQTGAYFEIKSDKNIITDYTTPFVLSLPVPQGADVSHLAVAAYFSSEWMLDAGDTGMVWMVLPGKYNAVANTFEMLLPSLLEEGVIFTLVENPGFNSLELPKIAAPQLTGGLNPDFAYICDWNLLLACANTPGQYYIDLTTKLREVNNELISMGFRAPQLNVVPFSYDINTNQIKPEAYLITLSDARTEPFCRNTPGSYSPAFNTLQICVEPDANGALSIPGSNDFDETIRHEMFHAVQSAYPKMRTNVLSIAKWFTEGTARSAEYSYVDGSRQGQDLMERNSREIWFHIEDSLIQNSYVTSPNSKAYQTQDFWVYVGARHNRDMDYLIPAFGYGGTTLAIRDYLSELSDTSAGELYWRWVKNQAFELEYDYNDSIFGLLLQCIPNGLVLYNTNTQADIRYGEMIRPPYGSFTRAEVVPELETYTIPPLTTILLRMEDVDGLPALYENQQFKVDDGVFMSGLGSDPEIKFKIYTARRDVGCAGIEDGDRALFYRQDLERLPSGVDVIGYVLVSNTSFTDSKKFVLTKYRILGDV